MEPKMVRVFAYLHDSAVLQFFLASFRQAGFTTEPCTEELLDAQVVSGKPGTVVFVIDRGDAAGTIFATNEMARKVLAARQILVRTFTTDHGIPDDLKGALQIVKFRDSNPGAKLRSWLATIPAPDTDSEGKSNDATP